MEQGRQLHERLAGIGVQLWSHNRHLPFEPIITCNYMKFSFWGLEENLFHMGASGSKKGPGNGQVTGILCHHHVTSNDSDPSTSDSLVLDYKSEQPCLCCIDTPMLHIPTFTWCLTLKPHSPSFSFWVGLSCQPMFTPGYGVFQESVLWVALWLVLYGVV